MCYFARVSCRIGIDFKAPLSFGIRGQKIPFYDIVLAYRYIGHELNISKHADLILSQQLEDFKENID